MQRGGPGSETKDDFTLHVFSRDGLYRVRAGPYPREAEARRDADRISQSLGVRPFVLTR